MFDRMSTLARTTVFTIATCMAAGSASFADTTQTTSKDTSMAAMSALEPSVLAAGGGLEYDWGNDHIFVKLASDQTGGALTLIQDNLKPGFKLGMHLHREHTEIFYLLEGDVEFETPHGDFTAQTGSVVYLGAGTPHAAHSTTGGRMLMFYAPGGFDKMLSEIENASWLKKINPFERARRNARHDFHKAEGTEMDTPLPVFVVPSDSTSEATTSSRTVKLSLEQTNGLAMVAEETLAPNVERASVAPEGWSEILYVLDGEVSLSGETQTAATGATLYFPVGSEATLVAKDGARILSYITEGVK